MSKARNWRRQNIIGKKRVIRRIRRRMGKLRKGRAAVRWSLRMIWRL